MPKTLTDERIKELLQLDVDARYRYLIKQVVESREIWILTDEHGCVMLNTEDDDCVPVWPNQEFAALWATGEWEDCQPQAISLNKWHSRWTNGLLDDELSVVAFPNADLEGVILFPDEFDFDLTQQAKKQR
ncbi:DUF2750 domain-containing protein [Vibrio sp. SM6]|uniref:DUF2750 domain-containing protein n=1 Tax=Vibrio agarilyticus TaxID=2726741 RepID=A0A7X8TSG5_9VIBR|nr:DUF2750 domain-containing protein [Vibrio agarilyticus]NLS13438.1 DUF2750 domain-containing protein [Vibrio agarilyticus]